MRIRMFIALAVALAAASVIWTYASWAERGSPAGSGAATALTQAPPAPPAMILRPLSSSVAVQVNDRIEFSDAPNPPAPPFLFTGSVDVYHRALTCLTAAVYYEAANEPEDGQRAVAQVVLNRVRHPAYPASICGVVYQGSTLPTGCQFTFTCDGSLRRGRSAREWERAEVVAAAALAGSVLPTVGHALNYHANFVVPYWATSLAKKAVVGTHIFYRLPGWWGRPRAFRRTYAGVEADPITLQATALAARRHRGPSRTNLPKPLVSAEADSRVEVVGIVALLASPSTAAAADTPYIRGALADFSPFSNHVAVQIYRQLAAKDDMLASRLLAQITELPAKSPASALDFPSFALRGHSATTGAGLAEALSAFARDTNFAAFLEKQQTHYRSLKESNLALAVPIVTEFQNYTGTGAGAVKLVVAPMFQHNFVANCFSASRAEGQPLIVLATTQGASSERKSSAAEAAGLIVDALARKAVLSTPCGVQPARAECKDDNVRIRIVQESVARALASRAAPSVGAAQERRHGKNSYLATVIAEALKSYEQNRTWFPTFGDFYPVLMDTLASSQRQARIPTGALAARLKVSAARSTRDRTGRDLVCDALTQG